MQEASDLLSGITVDPAVCGGRPCIRGMRIRVSDIIEMVAGGMTFGEVLSDFTYLDESNIRAALRYAALAVDRRIIRAA